MTKKGLLVYLLLLGTMVLSAQQINASKLPKAVALAFSNQQPLHHNAKWKREAEGFRVDFKNVRQESAAFVFAGDGKLLLSENSIAFEELPATAQRLLKGKKTKQCKKIKDYKGRVRYTARVGRKWLFFSTEGKAISRS